MKKTDSTNTIYCSTEEATVVRTIQTLNDLPSHQIKSAASTYSNIRQLNWLLVTWPNRPVFLASSVVGFLLFPKVQWHWILVTFQKILHKSEHKEEKTPNLQNTVFRFIISAVLTLFFFNSKINNPQGPLEIKNFHGSESPYTPSTLNKLYHCL